MSETPDRSSLVPAAHVFLRHDEMVLLLKRDGTGWGDGLWSVPAGHLDVGESVIAGAHRELQEEVGVAADLRPVGVMHRRAKPHEPDRIDFFLEATSWVGEPRNLEPHKASALEWWPARHPPEGMVPYVRRALDNLLEQRWFDAFGW